MITGTMIGDLKANAAFQQARHQNNFYFAQEMLKSASDGSGGPSEKLQEVQVALKAIVFPTADMNKRIQMVQDALAMQQLYLTEKQIRQHFLDSKGDLKPGLVPPVEMTWANLALAMMKEGLKEYNDVKKTGKTRDEYVVLANDLVELEKAWLTPGKTPKPTNRNDLWAEVNKAGKLENFAKKVNLNKGKIDAHRDYLDAGFFGLAENVWWAEQDKAKPGDFAAQSAFRDHVLKGSAYKPVCYMRATSTAPRGAYQGRKPEDSTRRVVFKNPPWSMTELAVLFNGATSKTITANMVGTEPPLNRLFNKDNPIANPFNNVVFQVSGTWYIMGGRVDASDNLILQKVELEVGADGKPVVDAATGDYIKKLSTAGTEIISMFSASEMKRAKDASGAPMNVNKVIEDGLQTLIKACDYGVSANDKPSDEKVVNIDAEGGPSVLLAMDDSALLREWLLTPGFDLERDITLPAASPAQQAIADAQNAIFKGLSDTDKRDYLNNIRAAAVAGLSPAAQDAALQNAPLGVYDFLRANPAAYAALAEHSAKAAAAYPDLNQAAIDAIKNRGADNGVAFKKLPNKDKEAFRAVVLGGVLERFMERAPIIAAMTDATARTAAESVLRKELNEMIAKEEGLFTGATPLLQITPAGGLVGALNQIVEQMDTANANANTFSASTLFATQREELQRAIGVYRVLVGGPGAPLPNAIRFNTELRRNNISLAAANIIPMTGAASYTDPDKAALRAIAWVDVMDTLITALKKDPKLTTGDLVTLLDNAIKDQRGILIHLDAAQLAGMPSGTPDQVMQSVFTRINDEVNHATGTLAFASQRPACEQVRDSINNAITASTASGDPVVQEILKAPPSGQSFENASLAPVAKEIAARQYAADPDAAVGFARRADTAAGAIVLEAAASGAIDYLSVGLMHYVKNNTGVPLVVNANGKNLEIVQCAPPAGAIPGKAYFSVMDGAAEYKPNYEERVELQKQLQEVLKGHAEEAMKQAAVRPDMDKVVQVTPNKDDDHIVDVNNTPSKAAVAAPASTGTPPGARPTHRIGTK